MARRLSNIAPVALAVACVALAVVASAAGWGRVLVALWAVALVFGVGFLFWMLLFVRFLLPVRDGMREAEREHRRRRRRCVSCGYDLRATPDRCPECGQAVSVNPAA